MDNQVDSIGNDNIDDNTTSNDPTIQAISDRAKDLSLSIINPETLARKLRESLVDLVGNEKAQTYFISASLVDNLVNVRVGVISPNVLLNLKYAGNELSLSSAYQKKINGWDVAVGVQVGTNIGKRGVKRIGNGLTYNIESSFMIKVSK